MTLTPGPEARRLHTVRNHLSVVIGFCDLLLAEITPEDPKYKDLIEMQKAANAALALLEGATELR